MSIYKKLKNALNEQVIKHNLQNEKLTVKCRALSAQEAIGNPEHNDYPIIKGKELMIEADFKGSKGQAFSDDFENREYYISELIDLDLNSNKKRASFIAGLNAVYRYLNLTDKTVHCRDKEPKKCSEELKKNFIGVISNILDSVKNKELDSSKLKKLKILQIGLQPRFLEVLSQLSKVKVIDLDKDNIGRAINGVEIKGPEHTDELINKCDIIFATGSTIVNDTIQQFLDSEKPVIFYGVTISAPAKILGLNTFCEMGH